MDLNSRVMHSALDKLDQLLAKPLRLIIGGGGAMVLAYNFPLATSDIDGFPVGADMAELDKLIKKVAKELMIPGDWLNPYFSTFTHVLPSDYGTRLKPIGSYKKLSVEALSLSDLLIMKCFAGRQKDVVHAKALIKKGADIKFVESHLEHLKKRNIPGAIKSLEFLDDILDQI